MTLRRLLPPLLLVAVAGAALLAGCGGERSPRARAADDYREIRARINQLRDDVAFEVANARLRTNAELSEAFGALMRESRAQAAALAAMEPPPALAPQVDALRRAIELQADDLWRTAAGASQLGAAVPDAYDERLRRRSERIAAATSRLDEALQVGGT